MGPCFEAVPALTGTRPTAYGKLPRSGQWKERGGVKPTLAADELRRNLTHYLTTTFALAEQPVRDALEGFLNDPDQGIFRGPYVRIRTPFRHAEDGWRDHLGSAAAPARTAGRG